MLVAPNTAEDNVVLLPTLKRIHARYLDFFVQVFLQRAIELHVIHDIRPLAFIRSYNADLAGNDSRLEEFGDNLLHVRSFRPVFQNERNEKSETLKDLPV